MKNKGDDHCTCDDTKEEDKEYHSCPYAEEFAEPGEEEKLCACCDYCSAQCAEEI